MCAFVAFICNAVMFFVYTIVGEDVVSVSAKTAVRAHDHIEVEDTCAAILTFESGALGVLQACTSITPDTQQRLELHGTKGTIILEGTEDVWIKHWETERDGRREFAAPETHGDEEEVSAWRTEQANPHRRSRSTRCFLRLRLWLWNSVNICLHTHLNAAHTHTQTHAHTHQRGTHIHTHARTHARTHAQHHTPQRGIHVQVGNRALVQWETNRDRITNPKPNPNNRRSHHMVIV